MGPESMRGADQAVALKINENRGRLTKTYFEPVLQYKRRGVSEAGYDLENFAVEIVADWLVVALSYLVEEISLCFNADFNWRMLVGRRRFFG
jgi:hypothetical protein